MLDMEVCNEQLLRGLKITQDTLIPDLKHSYSVSHGSDKSPSL